jgi:dTDP-4-amino-4,6-dideoxygalactose transaminase
MGCFSFNGNKIITTGGGGMLVTDDAALAARARYLSTQAKDDAVRFVHGEVGYNYRLTNIQAAMGVAQLERMPEFLAVKRRNYDAYKTVIDTIPGLHIAETPGYADNNLWMYALQIDAERFGKDREEVMAFLESNHIQTRPVWHLNHCQKPYASNQSWHIELAVRMADITLNIPCSVDLLQADHEYVVRSLQNGAWNGSVSDSAR